MKELESAIIIIDKPIGPTSHKVCEYAKKILNVKRVGHSGTLDPKVTGVLPIALNKATRVLGLLLSMPKEYVGIMRLHEDASITAVRATIKKNFLGKITQLPPKKSAVKRQERQRQIYEFKLLEKKGKDVLFRVKCEAGTYIRKLIHDLGNELGTGAHMLELRRIAVGHFKEKDAVTLYELATAKEKGNLNKILRPIEAALKQMPKVHLKKSSLKRIKHGQLIPAKEILKSDNSNAQLAAFAAKKFVCLCKFSKVGGKKVLKPEKVFI